MSDNANNAPKTGAPLPKYETLAGQWVTPHVFHLQLNREKKLNAMSMRFFDEIKDAFTFLNAQPDLRCIVLTGNGKAFTAGLDLVDTQQLFAGEDFPDPARRFVRVVDKVKQWQQSFSVLEDVNVPVLVGVHGLCIGGGIDLITAGDVRYCTEDAKFTIKEIDIGIVADLGTIQRFPLKVGNDSLFRELAYTGRFFDAKEAKELGLVSKVLKNKDELVKALLETAQTIADKSPVAMWANKRVINSDFRRRIDSALVNVAQLNSAVIQSSDLALAVQASLSKEKPIFPKL